MNDQVKMGQLNEMLATSLHRENTFHKITDQMEAALRDREREIQNLRFEIANLKDDLEYYRSKK